MAPPKAERTGLTFALQALLIRHESYMAESEEERSKAAATIDTLEQDKRRLEIENATIMKENHNLHDQVRDLNYTVDESDAHIKSLIATLSSAQSEVRRLTALASRTAELEAQLAAMEVGQVHLEKQLAITNDDETSAVDRWKRAEGRLRDLQQQVERMEREASDEREKHVELVGRMERRTTLEKCREIAPGGLKNAAVEGSLDETINGSTAVSKFVRGILQENANMHAGIVELRDLLQASNEEIHSLRDQVMQHQPMMRDGKRQATSLSRELEHTAISRQLSQEVHVHHHYHGKISGREKVPLTRRNSKKRVSPGLTTATQRSLAPKASTPSRLLQKSTSPVSMTMPYPSKSNRGSTQSIGTAFTAVSSIPSSPPYFRSSGIFDRGDRGFESSQPTSPESGSSIAYQRRRKPSSDFSILTCADAEDERNLVGPNLVGNVLQSVDGNISNVPSNGKMPRRHQNLRKHAIGVEDVTRQKTSRRLLHHELAADDFEDYFHDADLSNTEFGSDTTVTMNGSGPALRRSTSQDSLVSICGMDIHLARRPHFKALTLGRGFSPLSPNAEQGSGFPFPSSKPLASIAEVNASSSKHRSSKDLTSSISLLSDLAATQMPQRSMYTERPGFGELVGGWVRKWGSNNTVSGSRVAAASNGAANHRVIQDIMVGAAVSNTERLPGVNQKGPIIGMKPLARTQSEVYVKILDEEQLRDALAE